MHVIPQKDHIIKKIRALFIAVPLSHLNVYTINKMTTYILNLKVCLYLDFMNIVVKAKISIESLICIHNSFKNQNCIRLFIQ